jgi:SAM-dependent methyltransferase
MNDSIQPVSKVTCKVCSRVITPQLVLKNIKNGWHIMRCPECALTFAHPQPDPKTIAAYYNGMYADLADKYSEQKMEPITRSVKGYLEELGKHRSVSSRMSLLDLGGGLGYYTKAFSAAGLSATLVEQDPVSIDFARRVLGIENIIPESLEGFFKTNLRTFDVVFFRHVIEHVTDPSFVIGEIYKCLADDGVLIIETDNNAGIEIFFKPGTALFYWNLYKSSFAPASLFSLLRRRPLAVDPPRHLFGFRLSNLCKLLSEHSFIPFENKCYRLGHPVYWPNLPSPSVRDILSSASERKLKRTAANIIDLALAPVRYGLEYFGLGSGICIYAAKQPSGQRPELN